MIVFRPSHSKEGIFISDYKQGKTDKLVIYQNKPPVWNNNVQAFVIDFHRRVTVASSKNF